MCENRRMSRVTGRFPIEAEEAWDAVDVYVDTINSVSVADMQMVSFDSSDIENPAYQLEIEMITEEMYVALMRHGKRYCDESEDLDFLYQVGMYHAITQVLEYLINEQDMRRDNMERSEIHFCVLAALEEAYQGNLEQDAEFFLEYLIDSGAPTRSETSSYAQEYQRQSNGE
jgi:hypothetical protein